MNDSQTLSERGAALREAEDYDGAIAVLRRAVDAGESEAPRLLALSLIEVNDREGARGVLVQAVEAGRNDLAGLLGDVADDLEDSTLAERSYRLAIDNGDVDALNDFGVFLRGQERYEEAIAVLRRAIESGDELASANLVLIYLEDLNDIGTAKSLGEQYLDESKPKTLTALASVYAESGALDEAEAMYRRAVDLGAPRAHVNLGWFLRDHRHDLAGAEREFRLAQEDDEPGWGYELGALLHDNGRSEEALDVLRYAAEWGDSDAESLLAELA